MILTNAGSVEIDQLVLAPDQIVQDDPWVPIAQSGNTSRVTVLNNASRAYQSSGLLVLDTTGSNYPGAAHAVADSSATVGSTYDVSAWVRSPSGTSITGRLQLVSLAANGSTLETFEKTFTATKNWQYVSFRSALTTSGVRSLQVRFLVTTTGSSLDIDNVQVQKPVWSSVGAVTQTQVNDETRAQSGSGYLRIQKASGSDAGVSLTTAGQMDNGSTEAIEIWVRSTNGTAVSGRLVGAASGGSGTDTATESFTATADWRKVRVEVPITATGRNSLLTTVFVDTADKGLDIDSMVNGPYPFEDPDGVDTELAHPDSGYVYLWNEAFGIPGAHLWAVSAEISIVNGLPGLGVGATVYFDPSKASAIMTGTDWIKGDMVLNVSESDPCFSVGFDARSKNSGVRIDGGVFTTKQFRLNFAPQGCEVGDYVVPAGSSFAFDTQLGDATFHLLLEAGRDDDNLPTFHGEVSIADLELAGTEYHEVGLTVDVSTTKSETSMVADMTLPMGDFDATYDLEASAEGIAISGSVSVSDWEMVGGTFDVHSFDYSVSMTVPTGAGACGDFQSSTSGQMSMGKKNYTFDGTLRMECGTLEILQFHYLYKKGGTSFDFYIDYDATSRELAGGLRFDFERRFSWKFLGHRYRRHPKIAIHIDFWMPIDKPSAGRLDFYGKISVSGGSGEVDCTFGGSGGDDGCDLHAEVKSFWGTRKYDSSW